MCALVTGVQTCALPICPFVDYLHHAPVTAEEVPHVARIAYANGMEGLVVKDADSVYVRGRSPTWLKVKNKITREARIVDMIIEAARAKTLLCKMLDDGRTVRVGSDIPEGLRARMGIDPASFAGAEIGGAHVWTPVTHAHHVRRLLLEKKVDTRREHTRG